MDINKPYKKNKTENKRHLSLTCMQHLQLQKHADSILQMQLLCIVPSCEYHIDAVTFEKDLLQSGYFQYMSATMMGE